jgi:hypothetical protein
VSGFRPSTSYASLFAKRPGVEQGAFGEPPPATASGSTVSGGPAAAKVAARRFRIEQQAGAPKSTPPSAFVDFTLNNPNSADNWMADFRTTTMGQEGFMPPPADDGGFA